MSPRERADSRPTLYMTENHAIANRRQISLREAILPVLVPCVPSCMKMKLRGDIIFTRRLVLKQRQTELGNGLLLFCLIAVRANSPV